jgi:ketosteroid isomerase-like protein
MGRRFSGTIIVILLLLSWVVAASASDQADINALMDRFETAIANDDIPAVEACLFRKGFFQVYDYSGKGVFVYGKEGMLDPEWFKSNRYVRFESRQINVEGNIAYIRCIENSLHTSGSNPHYKSLIIVVKDARQWFIAVLSGRQIDF